MAFVLSGIIGAILEIDEMDYRIVGENVEITFVTSGIFRTAAELKTRLWGLITPPFRILEVKAVEEYRVNPVTKRYKITAEYPLRWKKPREAVERLRILRR